MDKEELSQYLKENLKVKVGYIPGFYCASIKVTIFLNDEIITEDSRQLCADYEMPGM